MQEISRYLIAKLRWCLSELSRIFNGGGIEDDSEPSGLFVHSMNKFVFLLNDGDLETNVDITDLIDSLLCHALTIAKMAENEDYNEISAACRNASICSIIVYWSTKCALISKSTSTCCFSFVLASDVSTSVCKHYTRVDTWKIWKRQGIFWGLEKSGKVRELGEVSGKLTNTNVM